MHRANLHASCAEPTQQNYNIRSARAMRTLSGWGAFADAFRASVSARSLVACACLAASLVLAGCAAGGAQDAAKPTASGKGIVKVVPQRDWSDAVLYFVILDRYADGDS